MKRKSENQASAKRRRILVVDDHPITREGIAHIILLEPGLTVAGQAGDAKAALAAVAKQKPDLVLLDLSMNGRSGLELIKDLQALHPALPILVFSMHSEALYAERALRAGARGYLMKNEGSAMLRAAIQSVLRGEVYLSETMRDRIVSGLSPGKAHLEGDVSALLTDRELEIFDLIGQAVGTREIARRLGITQSTVEAHRAHIKVKLNLATATELVRAAVGWHEQRDR